MQDGRVEQWQVSSSAVEPRHNRSNIALQHPYSSWCTKDVADKFFEVRFIERRKIVGIYIQPDPLEHKLIYKMYVKYMDENSQLVPAINQGDKNVSIPGVT